MRRKEKLKHSPSNDIFSGYQQVALFASVSLVLYATVPAFHKHKVLVAKNSSERQIKREREWMNKEEIKSSNNKCKQAAPLSTSCLNKWKIFLHAWEVFKVENLFFVCIWMRACWVLLLLLVLGVRTRKWANTLCSATWENINSGFMLSSR